MNNARETFRQELRKHDVLFSCEGTAEEVIIETLVGAHCIIVPDDHLVYDREGKLYTGDKTAKKIQRDFLGLNYPHGLLLVRIVDVNPGRMKFNKLYEGQATAKDVIARTEIEFLILVREGEYQNWYRHGKGRGILSSQWCVQMLGMGDIKTRTFLEEYWQDPDELVASIMKYTSALDGHRDDQLNLADFLA